MPDAHFHPALALPIHAPRTAITSNLPDFPLVSVVMTAYNAAPWIVGAAQSILRQTWRGLELLIVDDCSDDGSHLLAKALAERDDRVRVFCTPSNAGTYRAKNLGMSHARGQVLTFMDSDDFSEPGRIEKQLKQLRSPGLVATTCNYIRHTPDDEIVLNRGLRERVSLISLMIKRQVLSEIGWFDSVRTSADDEFFERLRLVYGRNSHSNVAEPLYKALLRKNSLTTSSINATQLSAREGSPEFLSQARQAYVIAYRAWHTDLVARGLRPFMPFDITTRPFEVHETLRTEPWP